ncbi:MAG: PQQ-dependent catabolism-associated CXXCW motif protein [Pseudomonadota bacterium]|nr:PQQ-dependent catabolism-associated CXXCW motif protein [Pseudomonadota bacterium]
MKRPAPKSALAITASALLLLAEVIAGAGASLSPAHAAGAAEGAATTVAEPDAYRMDEYRAPVPATLQGGTVIDTAEAKRLHDEGVPFVDVLPRAPKPKGLHEGTVWRPKPRDDIPGSVWLVDTGYGELAPVMERYLFDGLAEVTGGDKTKPIVLYCQRDCWMSWNAAKRAIKDGYTAIHWYPDGTDGWAEAGYPLERAEPKQRPDE